LKKSHEATFFLTSQKIYFQVSKLVFVVLNFVEIKSYVSFFVKKK
jgi:hypothetical protein